MASFHFGLIAIIGLGLWFQLVRFVDLGSAWSESDICEYYRTLVFGVSGLRSERSSVDFTKIPSILSGFEFGRSLDIDFSRAWRFLVWDLG